MLFRSARRVQLQTHTDDWKMAVDRRAQRWRADPTRFRTSDPETGADAELASILAGFRAAGRSIEDAADSLGIDPAYARKVQQRALTALAEADFRNAAIVRSDANAKLDHIEAELQAIAADREQPAEVRVKALTGMRQVINDRVDLYGAKAKPQDSDIADMVLETLEHARQADQRNSPASHAVLTVDALPGEPVGPKLHDFRPGAKNGAREGTG